MPNIQIKDVPDDVHAVLRARAAKAGQSLQEYLLNHLVTVARQPTVAEVMERAGSRSGGRLSFEDAVRIIREDRDSR